MPSPSFESNRASIPIEELRKYAGQWVAFSLDGSRLVAGAETLVDLERRLVAAGEDPERVVFEKILFADSGRAKSLYCVALPIDQGP